MANGFREGQKVAGYDGPDRYVGVVESVDGDLLRIKSDSDAVFTLNYKSCRQLEPKRRKIAYAKYNDGGGIDEIQTDQPDDMEGFVIMVQVKSVAEVPSSVEFIEKLQCNEG